MNRVSKTTELVLRNIEEFRRHSLLVVDPPDSHSVTRLRAECAGCRPAFLHRDYGVYKESLTASDDATSATFDIGFSWPPQGYDSVLIYLPKGKESLDMTLGLLAASARNDVEVYLVGTNRAGIRSSAAVLSRWLEEATKLDSARHGAMFKARCFAHETGAASPQDWEQIWSTSPRGIQLTAVSLPGVFSHGRLDAGTAYLLEHARLPASGRILDMGCGSGIIGAYAAAACPESEVEMVDTSALAIASTRRTIEANGLKNARCYASHSFGNVSGKFDLIISNPPFHSGTDTDYRPTAQFISESARYLAPGGSLQLVANRFLPYQFILRDWFSRVEVLFENRRYRVYRAMEPTQRLQGSRVQPRNRRGGAR